jgi:hypothetical protein
MSDLLAGRGPRIKMVVGPVFPLSFDCDHLHYIYWCTHVTFSILLTILLHSDDFRRSSASEALQE